MYLLRIRWGKLKAYAHQEWAKALFKPDVSVGMCQDEWPDCVKPVRLHPQNWKKFNTCFVGFYNIFWPSYWYFQFIKIVGEMKLVCCTRNIAFIYLFPKHKWQGLWPHGLKHLLRVPGGEVWYGGSGAARCQRVLRVVCWWREAELFCTEELSTQVPYITDIISKNPCGFSYICFSCLCFEYQFHLLSLQNGFALRSC